MRITAEQMEKLILENGGGIYFTDGSALQIPPHGKYLYYPYGNEGSGVPMTDRQALRTLWGKMLDRNPEFLFKEATELLKEWGL